MKDEVFEKIEQKTKVSKDTILNLARKLQQGDFKNEDTLREVIHEISSITGKEVSEEKEQKIINMIKNDKVPTNMDKYI